MFWNLPSFSMLKMLKISLSWKIPKIEELEEHGIMMMLMMPMSMMKMLLMSTLIC
jgi:hypothetical protein